jgi:hypothetical protein
MNEHIAAGCPFDKTETLLVVEPFYLTHFLAHYSDSFILLITPETKNPRNFRIVGHYTKPNRHVNLTQPPKSCAGNEFGEGGRIAIDF